MSEIRWGNMEEMGRADVGSLGEKTWGKQENTLLEREREERFGARCEGGDGAQERRRKRGRDQGRRGRKDGMRRLDAERM